MKVQQVHSCPDQGRMVVDGLKSMSDPCFHLLSQELDLKVSSSVGQRAQAVHGSKNFGAFLSEYTIIITLSI